jgi:hypothetical protein
VGGGAGDHPSGGRWVRAALAADGGFAGQAEVADEGAALAVEQDVERFEVAVDAAAGVGVADGPADLYAHVERLVQRQVSAEAFGQVAAVTVLHEDGGHVTGRFIVRDVMHLDHVRMRQPAPQVRLAHEVLPPLLAEPEGVFGDLDGGRAVVLTVVGEVDVTHATFADQAAQVVGAGDGLAIAPGAGGW